MACRMYLPNGGTVPTISPPYWFGVTVTPAPIRVDMATTRQGTALASVAFQNSANGSATFYSRGIQQFVGPPMTAQTIAGTFTLVLKTSDVSTHAPYVLPIVKPFTQVHIEVYTSGNVLRGTLVSGLIDTVPSATAGEAAQGWATTLETRIYPPTALTSLDVLDGDRLVVTIGRRGDLGDVHNFNYVFGDPSATADHTLVAGQTMVGVPWIEFSQDLFAGGATNVTVTGSTATATSGAGAGTVSTVRTAVVAGALAAATALALAGVATGSSAVDVTYAGSTATATSTAQAGTATGVRTVTLTGSTATGTALALPGTVATSGAVTIPGGTAGATAGASTGTVLPVRNVTTTGSTATATSLALSGTVGTADNIPGSTATGSAQALPGSVTTIRAVTVTGGTSSATALALSGIFGIPPAIPVVRHPGLQLNLPSPRTSLNLPSPRTELL